MVHSTFKNSDSKSELPEKSKAPTTLFTLHDRLMHGLERQEKVIASLQSKINSIVSRELSGIEQEKNLTPIIKDFVSAMDLQITKVHENATWLETLDEQLLSVCGNQ